MRSHVLVSLLELLVALGCLGIAGLAWPHRDQPAGTPLVLLSLAGAGWGLTAAVASLVVDPAVTIWAQRGTYVFVGAATVCWFYVAAEFSGRRRWYRPPVGALVLGLLALDWLLVVTDPLHHLYITRETAVTAVGLVDPEPGPVLWLGAVWKTGLIVAAGSLVLRHRTAHLGVFHRQSVAVVVAGVIPVLTAVAELLDLVSISGLDVGVVGVGGSAGIVLWALFYADFLDVAPIARATLIESLPDAVVAIDSDGRVVDLNRAAMRLFDVDEDAVGAPVARVVGAYEAIEPGLELESPTPGELRLVVGDETRTYELAVTPVRSPAGRGATATVGTLLVFRNVTTQRERELDLELKNARLEEFSSVVSHDLRNPLQVAQGRLELAERDPDSGHFEAIERSLGRMDTLITDLLSLARTGRTISAVESVLLADIAATCWEHVDTADATLAVETRQSIAADPNRLQELVENIFRNAVEHGGATVSVTVGDLDDGAGFYVEDDGPGIQAADREQVFESGYSGRPDGTGLGLAIVREIASAHGWTARITDAAGGGTRFEFTLG